MLTRNIILSFLLTAQVRIVFSSPEVQVEALGETNVTSEETNSTNSQLVGDQGLLWAGLEYLLGETGNKLLFHQDSPVQYAANFDYVPLVSSLATVLNFIASEESPGYVLATYDYAEFLSRLSPIGHIAEHYTSGAIKTAIILVSSILSGYSIFLALAYGVEFILMQLVAPETVTEGRSGGRSLKHLHQASEDVLTAGENFQVEDSQRAVNWLSHIVRQSKLHYDDSSY